MAVGGKRIYIYIYIEREREREREERESIKMAVPIDQPIGG